MDIIGGLGNQMFQYAMGRALAERHGVKCRLDTRLFKGYCLHHGFELERVFEIDSPVATTDEIKNLIGWRSSRLGRRIIREKQLSFLKGRHFYVENGITFNEKVFSLPANCYLSGYWQSERYFKDYEFLIRGQFKFKLPLAGKNIEFAEKIANCIAVSLHVRRGDYVSNPRTNAAHGVCSVKYYEKAMRYIEERVKDPVYFVFSDDIDWVKENIMIYREHHFIDHNSGFDSFNDMHLMSLCKHHIIANSSFSWWGGWLNPNSEKIIIAPDKWFQIPDWDSSDHVPTKWIRL